MAPLLISVTPTVSATPDYADGDAIGGLLSITLPVMSGPLILDYVSVSSKADLTVAVDLVLFNANPADSTFTDNGAMTIHANDYAKVYDVLQLASDGWIDLGTNEVQTERNLGIPVVPASRTLYAALLSRGVINLASTSDLTVHFGFRDR